MGVIIDIFGDFWNPDPRPNPNEADLQKLGLSETSDYIASLEKLVIGNLIRGSGKSKQENKINRNVRTRKRVLPQKNIAHKMVEEDYERDK